jgi:hypothetical protein
MQPTGDASTSPRAGVLRVDHQPIPAYADPVNLIYLI